MFQVKMQSSRASSSGNEYVEKEVDYLFLKLFGQSMAHVQKEQSLAQKTQHPKIQSVILEVNMLKSVQ